MNTLHIIYILLSTLVLLGIITIVLLMVDLRRIARNMPADINKAINPIGKDQLLRDIGETVQRLRP